MEEALAAIRRAMSDEEPSDEAPTEPRTSGGGGKGDTQC
jgi:hypothetical protein